MGDSIFDNDTDDTNDDDIPTVDDFKAMQKTLADTAKALEAAQSKITDLENKPTPPPTPQQPANDPNAPIDSAEALRRFADDPEGYTRAIANGQISQAVQRDLGPLLAPIIKSASQGIISSQRNKFDTQFGAGTFDEVILPSLQSDLDRLSETNSSVLSDEGTISALVDRVAGQKRTELNKAEETFKTSLETKEKEDVARVISHLPPSMQPRPKEGITELSAEDKAVLDKIAEVTGERPDERRLVAVANADSGVTGYLEAVESLDSNSGKEA